MSAPTINNLSRLCTTDREPVPLSKFDRMLKKGVHLLRSWNGPLTEELARTPGRFGLGQVPEKLAPDKITNLVCGYCSTGCNLRAHQKGDAPVNLTADTNYPVNLGMGCPKGWEALTPLTATNRATSPLLDGETISWHKAADTFCQRMKSILAEHGPESVAFLSTGQICTEEMAFLGAFAKFGMGLIHGDGNTRQCMATSVVAYKQAFGFDAPPYTYEDFEQSDVLVFIGANPCIAHPIMWQRVLRNQRNPEIIVIDPRYTETAQASSWHIQLKPKGDLALLYSVAHVLIHNGWIDSDFVNAHTRGFEAFKEFVTSFSPESVADSTGVCTEDIEKLARLVRTGKRVSFWWTMGVNQSHQATRTAQAIINLALMGGHIGKPGTGANSITGQCNAMGSRLFSNTTNLLGGHDFSNAADREKIASALGISETTIPRQPSLAYDQILERIEAGKIKALWVVATNPAHSWINQGRIHALREKLEFLVVQDMYRDTHTARMADLILPAAAWGEKEGTFINSERRIGVVRPVSKPPGEALPDFHIFKCLADAWGCGNMFEKWTTPEAVFRILQQCSKNQPCDITGIDGYTQLSDCGGIQWPVPDPLPMPPQTHRRLFEDGTFFTADKQARFVYDFPSPLPEPTDDLYPLTLITGRGSSAQWHTETRTRNSEILRKLHPNTLLVDVHPADAKRLAIESGSIVAVISRRGKLTATARISPTVRPSEIFLPMHDPRVNRLTHWAVDPHSRQPSFKACAVRLAPLDR